MTELERATHIAMIKRGLCQRGLQHQTESVLVIKLLMDCEIGSYELHGNWEPLSVECVAAAKQRQLRYSTSG